MSLIVNEMFKRSIITKDVMNRKCALFKQSLFGPDKRSWLPSLKGDSFKTKLPGNMSQNHCFIRYLSILLLPELKGST